MTCFENLVCRTCVYYDVKFCNEKSCILNYEGSSLCNQQKMLRGEL